MKGRRFELDTRNGKVLGVCAGIARYTGIDATIVRVAAVLATVVGGFPWTIVAYFGAAFLARPRDNPVDDAQLIRDWRADSREAVSDHRIDALGRAAASKDSALAREIDALR